MLLDFPFRTAGCRAAFDVDWKLRMSFGETPLYAFERVDQRRENFGLNMQVRAVKFSSQAWVPTCRSGSTGVAAVPTSGATPCSSPELLWVVAAIACGLQCHSALVFHSFRDLLDKASRKFLARGREDVFCLVSVIPQML